MPVISLVFRIEPKSMLNHAVYRDFKGIALLVTEAQFADVKFFLLSGNCLSRSIENMEPSFQSISALETRLEPFYG